MASFMKDFEHLEIQLEDIISATNNFDENKVIGRGGFGKVYAGELSHSQSGEKSLVAIKRLDRRYGQGDTEFFKEIRMLSRYRHENLISLLGFCSQGSEMILIYEYATHGSLDRCLSSADLAWTQRLRICIDAAKGLSFLHDPNGTHQRVLHCDIKSGNILLDKNMTAKVSDFGLSKMGPANQQCSLLITDALGTPGYCDPLFFETCSLTKESDVYSFGVVLFEVLSGKLCSEYSKGVNHVPMWKQSYEEKKLDRIILEDIKKQIIPGSLETFSSIAYQCLNRLREERPTMSLIVEKLKIALQMQILTKEYVEIANAGVDPQLYRSEEEFKKLLSKGVLLNGGKTRLYINEKEERFERIYIEACLNPAEYDSLQDLSGNVKNSRFPGGRCYEYTRSFNARARPQYLSPQISYTAYLFFRYDDDQFDVNAYSPLRYKIDGEDDTKVFAIYPSTHMREDGWFIAPLDQFTSQHKTADLQFEFEHRATGTSLLVAGIEFQPSEEKVELQVYQDIVQINSQSLLFTSIDEHKQNHPKGFYLNGYKTWFSVNEKGQHCHMISMVDCLIPNEDFPSRYKSHNKSRFAAGLYQTNHKGFKTHVKAQLLSPSITYTVNLVFFASQYVDQAYVDLTYRLKGETTTSTVYLANRRRNDDLYIAELYQFTSNGSIDELEIIFDNHGSNLQVEGVLFEPLEMVEDQVSKDDKVENIQTISDSESDTYWEQKFPDEFLINDGQEWFTVDKHGKKCSMLSARSTWVIDYKSSAYHSSDESRFGEVLVITSGHKFEIKGKIKSELVSPKTKYAGYLVYKLPQDQSIFETPIFVRESKYFNSYKGRYIYLVSPPVTPVIGSKLDINSYNLQNRHKLNNVPRQRSDGWMEVKLFKFETEFTTKKIYIHLELKRPCKKDLSGLIVQGIGIRPI